jgi:hypothetical protein
MDGFRRRVRRAAVVALALIGCGALVVGGAVVALSRAYTGTECHHPEHRP